MAAGYEETQLGGASWLLLQNAYAVDVFVIVSGYVIFLLLDTKGENYKEFICRRFFRLYPVFIILFGLSIPMSLLWQWNLQHDHYLATFRTNLFLDEFSQVWHYWRWNIAWHLPMLHGIAPDSGWHKCTDTAFLGAAWSISLEWQFYLMAPLAYLAAISSKPLHRLGICVFCLYLFMGKNILPKDLAYGYALHGAFLPFHVEYFFIGAVSYFAYKKLRQTCTDVFFPVSVCVAIFIWHLDQLISISLWVMFLGLLLEHPDSLSRRFLARIFEHPLAQFIGRISYSIYLSHILVLVAFQYLLLKNLPNLSQANHFWILLVTTTFGTILVSWVLYRLIEAPGIRLGHKVATHFGA